MNFVSRKIYWLQSNAAGSLFSLFRSELDGSHILELWNILEKPLGIAIDMNTSRIYWITQNSISSVLPDGSQNQTMAIDIGTSVGGLVLFKDSLYTCEIQNPTHLQLTVSAINKFTGIKTIINQDLSNFCLDISVYHSSLQKGK